MDPPRVDLAVRSHRNRIVSAAAAFLFLAVSAAAGAVLPADEEGAGSVALPFVSPVRTGDRARQAELESGAAWRDFRARHGEWWALWNETTGSPHRAFGQSIALPGFGDDAASADRAVRAFIAGHPTIFGRAPELRTASAHRVRATWYVRYQQTFAGVPVAFSDWEFRVGTGGKLFAFGADVQRPKLEPRTRPLVVGAVAREAARAGLAFHSATDRVEGGRDLCLIPWRGEDGKEFRLAWEARVVTAEPPGDWLTYVDAVNGAVLYRQNEIRYDISGSVSGGIHPAEPTDAVITRRFPHQFVQVGSVSALTDTSGTYAAAAGPGAFVISAELRGPYCDVNRNDGADAAISTSATDPAVADLAWSDSNSQIPERDAYISANVAHDYIKRLDPTFTGLDYSMPCAVNVDGNCNAFWNGTGLNFFAAGGGCPSIASIADIVYHEYGHGVNDRVYISEIGVRMHNSSLHEGMADVNSCFMRDDPVVGHGFRGPGTYLRRLDNTSRYPEDRSPSGDPHITGLILGGAFWDLRQAVGLAVAERLAHYARYGTPDDPDDGVAMYEYFIETLVADDDDANLANGTPHGSAIAAAFNAHGIGTGFMIRIAHLPPEYKALWGQLPITATAVSAAPIGALDRGSVAVHFSVNHGPFVVGAMHPTGHADEFAGVVPVPAASEVRYYFTASDNLGGSARFPSTAPEGRVFRLVAGPASTVVSADMETNPGWTIGAPGDLATTGIWVRDEPVGTSTHGVAVQPGEDHTPPPGTECFVTGNGPGGDVVPSEADVDGGRTTLTTAAFDASDPGVVHPMVEYYRWFSNDQGSSPSSDFWTVDISNDGGTTWTHLEHTLVSDGSWQRQVFRIEDFVEPSADMKLRFIADDEAPGSLVEAAVDDFRVFGFPAWADVASGPMGPDALSLAATPNPSAARTVMRYVLPTPGYVSLGIFDTSGRRVRTLVNGSLAAGAHVAEWDGCDEAGHRAASGAYFARLRQGERERVRRFVQLQ